jgi:hypothetical protein
MKRRQFFERLGVGSAALVSTSALAAPERTTKSAAEGQHDHRPLNGPLASATVNFGAWRTEPPLDRYPNVPPAPSANAHLLLPFVATIKAGGSVSFNIAGLHQVAVYAPGTTPADIHAAIGPGPMFNNVRLMTAPPNLPLINVTTNRLYVGPDPSLLPLDRVEVVHFTQPGLHLVICAFLFHFLDNMYGWVRVLPPEGQE